MGRSKFYIRYNDKKNWIQTCCCMKICYLKLRNLGEHVIPGEQVNTNEKVLMSTPMNIRGFVFRKLSDAQVNEHLKIYTQQTRKFYNINWERTLKNGDDSSICGAIHFGYRLWKSWLIVGLIVNIKMVIEVYFLFIFNHSSHSYSITSSVFIYF